MRLYHECHSYIMSRRITKSKVQQSRAKIALYGKDSKEPISTAKRHGYGHTHDTHWHTINFGKNNHKTANSTIRNALTYKASDMSQIQHGFIIGVSLFHC